MRQEAGPDKLVALVADRDIEEALTKLFRRTAALGVGELRCDITKHPGRDAGCRGDATNFLRQFLRTHRYGLVVFDPHGCGSDASREEIEAAIGRRFVPKRMGASGACRRHRPGTGTMGVVWLAGGLRCSRLGRKAR